MNAKFLVPVILIPILLIAIYVGMSISYKNDEVQLRNEADAQQKNLENIFDRVWKIIQQKAQVAEQYKTAFKENYTVIMGERYKEGQSGGALFNFIREHNPEFSHELYADLSRAIESERINFSREQTKMLDIAKEHKNLIQKFPGSWFLSGVKSIEVKLVTSARTSEAFATGQENEVDVFGK